jgi:hypothetical protein
MAQEPDAGIDLDMGADASRTVGNALAEHPPAASMDVFESEGAFGGGRLAHGFPHRAFGDMAAVQDPHRRCWQRRFPPRLESG